MHQQFFFYAALLTKSSSLIHEPDDPHLLILQSCILKQILSIHFSLHFIRKNANRPSFKDKIINI